MGDGLPSGGMTSERAAGGPSDPPNAHSDARLRSPAAADSHPEDPRIPEIVGEIRARLGFLPPHLAWAVEDASVLENLWRQTEAAYLDNPIPAHFKETLLATLARFCRVPYGLICQACALPGLGMSAHDVRVLLERPLPSPDHDTVIIATEDVDGPLDAWPEPGTFLTRELQNMAVALFLGVRGYGRHVAELRRLLRPTEYAHLAQLLAYAKTYFAWVEAHPEVAPDQDLRYCEHYESLLQAEPRLAGLLHAEHDGGIPSRGEVDASLVASERRFRLVAENARDVIFLYQLLPTPHYEYVSPSAAAITGFTPEEYYADPLLGFKNVHPDDRAQLDAQRSTAELPEAPLVFRSIRKDGTAIWTEQHNHGVYDEVGRLIAVEGIARDITQRKRAEDALRESELRFRSLVESASDAIIVADRTGNIVSWNHGAEALFGFTSNEAIGRPLTIIVPERFRDAHLAGIERLREGGEERLIGRRVRITALRKDGRESPVDLALASWTTKEGRFYTGIVRDVTEDERARQLWRLLHDTTLALGTASDLDSALSTVMRRMCETMSWACGEVWLPTADGAALVRGPAWYREHGLDAFRAAGENLRLEPGQGAAGRAWASGEMVWFESFGDDAGLRRREEARAGGIRGAVAVPVISGDELAAILIFCMFEEGRSEEGPANLVTAVAERLGALLRRRQDEERLRRSEAMLAEAQQTAHVGSWEWDMAPDVVMWSDELYRIFGRDPSSFGANYQAYLDCILPEDRDRVHQIIEQAHRDRQPFSFEHGVVRPNGEVRHLHARGRVITGADGQAIRMSGIAQDITDRRQAVQALIQHSNELSRSNAELEQFAYVASHDLQEPLRMVSSYVQLLGQRYRGRLDPDADQFIGFAVEGTHRMQALIRDLLLYSRVGRAVTKTETVECREVVARVLENLRAAIEESGAEVVCEELPCLEADPTQLAQLFQNLISNALKFRGSGQPRLEIGSRRDGSHWSLWVKDNGIGVEPQYAERIFGIFQRLHTRQEYPGTGIGLAICRKIVESRGGRIWVESRLGQGATFHFTVPTADAVEAPEPAGSQETGRQAA